MVYSPPVDKEFFSIGEVSKITGVKPYILRYWESEFGLLRPSRRESGQRRFTRKDLEKIQQIQGLLYEKRFTIQGAKKYLRQQVRKGPSQLSLEFSSSVAAVEALHEVKKEVNDILKYMKSNDFKVID